MSLSRCHLYLSFCKAEMSLLKCPRSVRSRLDFVMPCLALTKRCKLSYYIFTLNVVFQKLIGIHMIGTRRKYDCLSLMESVPSLNRREREGKRRRLQRVTFPLPAPDTFFFFFFFFKQFYLQEDHLHYLKH